MPRDVLLGAAPISAEQRATIQEATSFCAAELMRENGGARMVAELLGITTTRAYNFGNRNNPEQISFWRVAALTSEKATAAVRYLAQLAGLVVFCPPRNVQRSDALALLGASARSHGEAIAEGAKALADGLVSPAEAATLVKEIDEAICDLARLRVAAVAMAEGGK